MEKPQYQPINAAERVVKSKANIQENLVALEHQALYLKLFKNPDSAKFWWKDKVHWCGVIQKLQPFRKSVKDESLYFLYKNNELTWEWKNESVYPPKMGALSGAGISIKEEDALISADGVSFWFDLNPLNIYKELAMDFNFTEEEASQYFGELRLVSYKKDDISEYKYFPNFGVYQEVKL